MKKIFISLLMIMPFSVMAQSADDALNNAASTILGILTGPLARTCAIIAVVALGYFGLTGRMNGRLAFSIVIGIAIIFGAPSIVDLFSS